MCSWKWNTFQSAITCRLPAMHSGISDSLRYSGPADTRQPFMALSPESGSDVRGKIGRLVRLDNRYQARQSCGSRNKSAFADRQVTPWSASHLELGQLGRGERPGRLVGGAASAAQAADTDGAARREQAARRRVQTVQHRHGQLAVRVIVSAADCDLTDTGSGSRQTDRCRL